MIKNKKRSGFTLTELAIVLLIAGLIISAIWVAAGSVWTAYRANRVMQQMAQTVQNIRDYYVNTQSFAISGDVTGTLDGLNLFPVEMRRNPMAAAGAVPIDHAMNNNIAQGSAPVNGSFHVVIGACSTACFITKIYGLTQNACIKLLTSVPITSSELGIVSIAADVAAPLSAPFTATVTPSTAQTWCSIAGDTNEIDVTYKLHT